MVASPGDLLAAFEAGRKQWPDLSLSFEEFTSRVAALEVSNDDVLLRGPDLVLAIACGAGDAAAIRHFDATFLSQVDWRVARFGLAADKVDDLRQKIRMKLLVGPLAGIRGYRGRAPLGAWVHVTAVRFALEMVAPTPPSDATIDLLELASPDPNPELATARKLYEERFRVALEDCFQALPRRDKTILRLHVVDGLTIDAIGAIYGVHRATAARWLVGIRTRVFDKLKQEFAVRWRASSSEVRSLVRLLQEHIHITVKRILGSDP